MPILYTQKGALCGAFLVGTTLCGVAGDQYILPDTLTLQDDDVDFRFEEQRRAWQDGSILYGEEWEPRDIVLAGPIWQGATATTATTQALVRAIKQAAARLDQRLEIDAGQFVEVSRLRRMDVRPVDITGRTVLDCRLTWRAAVPFWQQDGLQEHVEVLTGDDTFTVDTGTLPTVAMHPVIVFECPDPGSLPSVRLRNVTDDGETFLVQDPSLVDGAVLTVDSGAGTCKRDGANAIRFYTGGWLRLLPGANQIEYEGGAVTVRIYYRRRWI